ncbi:hypothetical protein TNCV_3326261 [Trichonephila clavipes]|nr:hypothetical protein TNCV_3326261 [Trichonephila clavipes]
MIGDNPHSGTRIVLYQRYSTVSSLLASFIISLLESPYWNFHSSLTFLCVDDEGSAVGNSLLHARGDQESFAFWDKVGRTSSVGLAHYKQQTRMSDAYQRAQRVNNAPSLFLFITKQN